MIRTTTQRGFTLLETIVGIGIFSVLMLMGTVALFTTIHAQRKTSASQRVLQNADFAIDSMIRDIRTGSIYYCGDEASASTYQSTPTSCPDGITNAEGVLAVESFTGDTGDPNDQTVFKFENNQIMKSVDGGQNFIELTAGNVSIDTLEFRVWGASADDNQQPRVFVLISGTAGTGTISATPFTIQTTTSQRQLDG